MDEINYGKCTTYLFVNDKLYTGFTKEFKSGKNAFAWIKKQLSSSHYKLRPEEISYKDWVKQHNFEEVIPHE